MDNENINLKQPPYNFEAEQAVLSSMLKDRDAIAIALETLKYDDFYRPDHQIVFSAMEEMFVRNVPVDIVTLSDKLVEKGMLEQLGGIGFLSKIASAISTSANARHYAKIVEEKSLLRKLIKAGNVILSNCYEEKDEISYIIEQAEKSIFDITLNRHTEQFHHIREVLLSSFDRIEQAYNSKQKITGVATGFTDFDDLTAGLQASDLILFAARPSMGKSALALNIAQHAAGNNNVQTAVFSLEMSKEQLVNRMLCSESLIDAQKLRTGNLIQEDWIKLARSMGPLSSTPIYFDDTPGITATEMRAKCRRLKLERGLGLVIIDYLQLMNGNGRTDSRQQEISEISRSLKAMAREIDAPVVALSQLSRACEQRANHRPMLSDLRESGAIEQDADVVSFIYRDDYYAEKEGKTSEKPNIAEIIIAKQRNGPTGTVELRWMGQYAKFANLEKAGY